MKLQIKERSGKKTICIIANQLLTESKIGGFGSMALQLGRYLRKEGWIVKILVPRRKNDPVKSDFEGIQIQFLNWRQLLFKVNYSDLDADIYHSQHQSISSTMVRIFFPDKIHIITCRDPRSIGDWVNEFKNATFSRKLKTPVSYLFEESLLATWAVKKADVVACPAKYLIQKIKNLYNLNKDPLLLPNLENIPALIPQKNPEPTVCWVGRFARRKNPEVLIELARKFPHVRFMVAGNAEEKNRQRSLTKRMAEIPNINYLGYIDKFRDSQFYNIYDCSWILVNTSTREGLPLTFIEAAGRGCAILSYVNPDQFAEEFGYWAKQKDFEQGLSHLLLNGNWKHKGNKAHEYVLGLYSAQKALRTHIELYTNLLSKIKN